HRATYAGDVRVAHGAAGTFAGDGDQLRQHHRAAAAAGRGRVVQRVLRDELARGHAAFREFRLGARGVVLRAHHRHGIRFAGVVARSWHGQHGAHVAGEPGGGVAGHVYFLAGVVVCDQAAGAGKRHGTLTVGWGANPNIPD